MNRIVGLETEYGCLTSDPAGPASAVGRVRNWIFERNRAYGLPDMHQRDRSEEYRSDSGIRACSTRGAPCPHKLARH